MSQKIGRFITLAVSGILWIFTRPLFLFYSSISSPKNNIQRILILAWGGIGNIILLTPVLKNLRRIIPTSKICVVVNQNNSKEVLDGSPWVDCIIVQQETGLKNIFQRARKVIRVFGKPTLSLTMVGISPLMGTLYSLFTGAKYRVGESRRGEGFFYTHIVQVKPHKHEVERNLDLLRKLSFPVKEKAIIFWLPPEIQLKVYHELKRKSGVLEDDLLITMAPGSGIGQSFKRWPAGHFARVAQWFVKNKFSVILLGDINEHRLCENIKNQCENGVYNMAGRGSLKETAAVISFSRMMISNDNGLMHVAASLKVPIVALFGPTLHYKNAPWGSPHRIVRTGIECSPCYNFQSFSCPIQIRCLTGLAPEIVIQAIQDLDRETQCLH